MLKSILLVLVTLIPLIRTRPWCSGTCGEEYVCDDPACICTDDGGCIPPPPSEEVFEEIEE